MSELEELDLEKFLREREEILKENRRIDELVEHYKRDMPDITPIWDLSEFAISFNDIDKAITDSGVCMYEAPFHDVWNGIYEPDIYSGKTLWNPDLHDNDKIAKVIEAWEKEIPLSPIFLIKHGTLGCGLVADGKHRLTVSHYLEYSQKLPFFVQISSSSWVKNAIPSAKKI